MKTLNEVIKAMNICQQDDINRSCDNCPYPDSPMCINELFVDALHYLKEYQKVDSNYWYEKAISELNNIADAYFLRAYREDKDELTALRVYRKEQNENAPLTWDELKQMEGKPVWVEIGVCKIWGLNDGVYVDAFGKEMVTIKVLHDLWHLRKEKMGDTDGWQAYRKERKATGGNLTPEPKTKKIGDYTEIKWSENDERLVS